MTDYERESLAECFRGEIMNIECSEEHRQRALDAIYEFIDNFEHAINLSRAH